MNSFNRELQSQSVPDAVKPPPDNPRFPLADSLRAIAVLSILTLHTSFLSSAYLGSSLKDYLTRLDFSLAIFFILSAFLLYRPYVLARLRKKPAPTTLGYLRRRALRILPAYWLILTLVAIYPGIEGNFDHDWYRYYSFTQIYSKNTFLGGITPAWSLCVEVSFYLALPLLAASMSRIVRDKKSPLQIELFLLSIVAIASLIWRGVFLEHNSVAANWLLGHMLWFGTGMALATISAHSQCGLLELPKLLRRALKHTGVIWLLAVAIFWFVSTQLSLPNSFASTGSSVTTVLIGYIGYGVISLLVIVPAVVRHPANGIPERILNWRVSKWIGLVSYSIFLWHIPVAEKLVKSWPVNAVSNNQFVLLTGLTVLMSSTLAALSYYLIERRFLKYK